MPNRELTTSTRYVQLIEPETVTDTGRTNYVDLQGWDAVDFLVDYGDVTAAGGSNNFVITLQEKDTVPGTIAGYTAVAAADRTGAFTQLENGVTSGNSVVGYKGSARYVHVLITETGTASAVIGVTAILRKFSRQPSNAVAVTTGDVT